MPKTVSFGLHQSDVENIISIFKNDSHIRHAIIFGSRAMGNFNDTSDIDIVLKAKDLSFNDLLDLKVQLEELNLPYKIDLLDYSKIEDSALLEHINRVGIQLF